MQVQMEPFYSKANQLHFAQPNCLKYLNLNFFQDQKEVRKNLLFSCTQLEKFGCINIQESEVDIVSMCIRLNSESLKCLLINAGYDTRDETSFFKLATAINKCQQLEELSFAFNIAKPSTYNLLPGNLKKLHLSFRKFRIEDMKVLVDKCSTLEDMFLAISCCDSFGTDKLEDSTCRHFEEALFTIVDSPLSDTLVNLSLSMPRIVIDEEQFNAKVHKLGQMKKLKNIEIYDFCEDDDSHKSKVKEIIRKKLPHLTFVDWMEHDYEARTKISLAHDFFYPADPYAKFSDEFSDEERFSGVYSNPGFWEIPCRRLGMFPDI